MKKRLTFVSVLIVFSIGLAVYALFFAGDGASAPRQTSENKSNVPGHEQHDTTTYNAFDTDYAQKMINLSQQSSELSAIEERRGSRSDLTAIAAKLKTQQLESVDKYKKLFEEMGEQYQDLSDYPQVDGHDAYPSYPGMATIAEITKFRNLNGSEIDSEFLRLMIAHYEGVLELIVINDEKIQYISTIELMAQTKKSYEASLKELKSLKARS